MTDYNRRAVFAIACAGMLVFGIVLTSLGAILPEITARYGVNKAQAGALFTLLTFGILVASLLFGPIVDRVGYKVPLAVATALVALGLLLIASSASLIGFRIGIACIGFGGGILNGATNSLTADITTDNKAAGLSLLGVFFGVGAVGVPFILGALASRVAYDSVLLVVAALSALPIVAMLIARFPQPKQPHSFPLQQVSGLLRQPRLLLLGTMLFLQSGMEITAGGWSATFAREELALDARSSLWFLSMFWLGMMGARLLLTAILPRVSPAKALITSMSAALAGALIMLTAHATMPASMGVTLIGAGLAAGFPVILGWVGEGYAEVSGSAFSIVLVMALTGGMILPYITGAMGGLHGLRGSLLVLPAALVLSSILLAVIQSKSLNTKA